MGGRNHDSGGGTHITDGIAKLRRRTDVVEYEHMQAIGTQDVSCNLGKSLGIVAAVVGNADTDVVSLNMLEDVVGKSLGGHADRVLVHPVCTNTHDAT